MKRVLVVGYYGLGNFGSEARLHMIIDDLKKADKDIKISVVTIGEYKEERFPGVEFINLKRVSLFNPIRLLPAISRHDIILNGEGIPFTDFCGKGFLAYFLPILQLAHMMKKKTICYAFDMDNMTDFDNRLTLSVLEHTDLLISRTDKTSKVLHDLGLKHKTFTTADPAFLFSGPARKNSQKRKEIGLVIKDFFCYPIVPRIYGRKELLYNYPYYYSYPDDGLKKREEFLEEMTRLVKDISKNHDAKINVLVLDHLMDYKISKELNDRLGSRDVEIHTYKDHNLKEMCRIISGLDLMVSSRLHGLIFSLKYGIPMIGLESDERFEYFFDYIGSKDFVDFRKKVDVNKLGRMIQNTLARKNSKKKLLDKLDQMTKKAELNSIILKKFLNSF